MPFDALSGARPLIVSIVGTRPEAIKMAPVIRSLAAKDSLRQELILTGQHRDINESFPLPRRAIHQLRLDLTEQTAGEICETLHERLIREIVRRQPALVLVQGDTTSALAGAMAARDCKVPIGHVEAGLRSGDLQQPWPEEGNRIRIDAMADLLFAPTEAAAGNLEAEARVAGRIHVTGNSGIDALLHARLTCPPTADAGERKLLLVTCHRRENQGPELQKVARALKRLVRELPLKILFPLHPNPKLRRTVEQLLGAEGHIELVEPLDHENMVCVMDRCWMILTDSGGLQEEGPALGKPVLVLRNVTERTEGIASDSVELVGTNPDRIFEAIASLLADEERYREMARPRFPFGNGDAAPRIADIIEEFLLRQPRQLVPLPLIRN